MRRNRALVVLGGVALMMGCAPRAERVTVDLSRVPTPARAPDAPSVAPRPPDPLPPASGVLESLPAQVVVLQDGKERIAAAQRIVEQSRKQAYEQVLRILRDTYRAEVQRWADDRVAELDPARASEFDGAFRELRTKFEAYADARGPKIARLALLAGFPEWRSTTGALEPRWTDEAKRLRAEVRALDSEFAQTAATLLADAEHTIQEEAQKIQREIQAAFADADARAEQTAAQQMTEARRDLDALLAGRTELELNAEPRKTLELPASTPVKSVPQLPEPNEPEPDVRQELALWLR
ncbi:MAG: hypothetical protein H6534_09700, partial [Chthonomonadaceae bacterium]|nr:hypothetical protein [Chthonomonadaceae bacterium]